MKEIFVLRHGKAEDISQCHSKIDFDRKLIEEGKLKATKLGKFLNKVDGDINIVISSPYLRAKETAEIIVNLFDKKPELKIEDFLSSGVSIQEISRGILDKYSEKDKILIVGHAPDLEIFLGKLIGAKSIMLKKGAIAKVILNSSIELSGELVWLITSKVIKDVK